MKHGWALVLAACAIAYSNSLENGFHFDDEHSIQQNVHIRSLSNIPRFFADPATFSVDAGKGMYRPLLLVTYALNYAAGGYDVAGYHWVNLILHGLNACLVWWLTLLLGGRREVALLAGLLFALHPLGGEPVNYISSRSESLAASFYLLGMGGFVLSLREKGWRWAVLSWIALALGLLSKSTSITLPAVLLVYDYLFHCKRDLRRLAGEGMRRHAPYWAISIAYLALIWANGFLSRSVKTPVRDGWTQMLTQIKAFAYYLDLLAWPVRLSVEHQFFEQREAVSPVLIAALGLLLSCLFLLFWMHRRRRDLPLFLSLWGLLALLPSSVVPLNVLVNERRLYLTCAAFCVGMALLLWRALPRRCPVSGWERWKIAGVLLLLVYGAATYSRNPVWKDDFSLWRDALAKAPLMPRVHLYLGNAHKDAAMRSPDPRRAERHWRRAAQEYQETIELDPVGSLALRALNNRGSVHFVLGEYDQAEADYRKAASLDPKYADALVNLGNIYFQRFRESTSLEEGRKALLQAVQFYRKALEILPNHAFAWSNMGLAYFHLGQIDQARAAYERAYFLNPRDERLLNNMGDLYVTLAARAPAERRKPLLLEARRLYQQARRINPSYLSPRRGLQYVEQLLKSGR